MGDILKSQIKLMQSQNLDDTDEGGGLMTVREVVDGNVNNLFPDISRLDRTYGRVNLRKAFLSVRTEDRSTYYGSHVVLVEQAKDPLVNVTFFTTSSWFDTRISAIDRIQSYLAVGSQFMAALYGNHYIGSRLLTLYTEEKTPVPVIGNVFTLTNDNVSFEYVRITKISDTIIEGADSLNRSYRKRQLTIEIGSPLSKNYTGAEVAATSVYASLVTKINSTVVADASKYYGTTQLQNAANQGDMFCRVKSIAQSIVPSAQSSSPITDFKAGNIASVVVGLDLNQSRSVTWVFGSNVTLYVGESVKPNSLTFSTYKDDGGGNFLNSANVVIGSIDYVTGTISLASSVASSSITATLAYISAAVSEQTSQSGSISIGLSNRGFAYVFNCYPPPVKRTLRVDYMAGGKWYSLYEQGTGEIKNEQEVSLGSGTLNFETGTVSLGLGYLPDIGSDILFFWGRDINVCPLVPRTLPTTYSYTLKGGNVARGSLVISWTQDTITKTIVDITGVLKQEGITVGKVNYGTGKLEFTPTCTPPPSTIFTYTYLNGESEIDSPLVFGESIKSMTLKNTNILPNSVFFDVPIASVPISGVVSQWEAPLNTDYIFKDSVFSRTVHIVDDGLGKLICAETKTIYGDIDYTTGIISNLNINEPFDYTKYTYVANEYPTVWENLSGGTDTWYGLYTVLTPTSTAGHPTQTAFTDNFSVSFRTSDGDSSQEETDAPIRLYRLDKETTLPLLAGSVRCKYGSDNTVLQDSNGKLVIPNSTATNRTVVGDINYSEKTVTITNMTYKNNSANDSLQLIAGAVSSPEVFVSEVFFRCPGVPIVPGSFTFRITTETGVSISITSNNAGDLLSPFMAGKIDFEMGIVKILFGSFVLNDATAQAASWYNAGNVSDDGVTVWKPLNVIPSTAIMSCVVSTYMPLDSQLLGLSPVRLPLDGKVPVFKDGDIVLVHHTLQYTCPNNLSANQVFNVGRTGLSMIELYSAAGIYVPEVDNYSVNLSTGDVTMLPAMNLTGFTQPLVALHRIEDMKLASDVQVTGHIAFTSALQNDYPADETMVSSVLPLGDLQARVYNVFTQIAWTSVWSNVRIGNDILSKYDSINYPIEIANISATQERWAVIFTATNTIQIVGEHLGVISGISILDDIYYPSQANPYFIIRKEGWGSGWATGNVLRFNTSAANYPLWFVRTTLQGTATETDDSYTIAIRGDSA